MKRAFITRTVCTTRAIVQRVQVNDGLAELIDSDFFAVGKLSEDDVKKETSCVNVKFIEHEEKLCKWYLDEILPLAQ